MKRRLLASLLVLVLLPALATAQRSRGGSGGGAGGGNRGGEMRAFKMPSRGDLEEMNPATFIIDKRKQLQLTDEQVAAIKTIEQMINERYKVNLTVYDSLRRNARPIDTRIKGASGASAGEQDEMRKAMQGLQLALMTVRNQRMSDVDAVLAAIADPAVKAKVVELFKEQQEEFDRLMPGGGRGGDRDR